MYKLNPFICICGLSTDDMYSACGKSLVSVAVCVSISKRKNNDNVNMVCECVCCFVLQLNSLRGLCYILFLKTLAY